MLTEVAETEAKKKSTGVKGLARGRSDLYRLSPSDIKVKEGFNSRVVDFDPEDAADLELAHSISENGVKQPVTVFNENGNVYLSDGHRRLGAALYAIANIEGTDPEMLIPVQVEAAASTEADRIFSQIVRNSSKPFTALEQSIVFKKLAELDWTHEDIAKKSGISAQRVRDLLDLNSKAPAKLKKMIQKGEVSATLAITTLKKTKGDGKKAAETLSEAVSAAKEQGKKKATAKDVKSEPTLMNPKARLRAIFTEIDITNDDTHFLVKMTPDEYAEVRTLIGF